MSSILDIDLDYFNLMSDPVRRLEQMLAWAGRPVGFVVNKHNHAVTRWTQRIQRGTLTAPSHILHVDEHHDMMDEKKQCNIGNCMYHAMRRWPACRVHWLVEERIDSPEMWLDDATWTTLASRFNTSRNIPRGWPKPDFVSVCTSPEFVNVDLLQILRLSIPNS